MLVPINSPFLVVVGSVEIKLLFVMRSEMEHFWKQKTVIEAFLSIVNIFCGNLMKIFPNETNHGNSKHAV